MKLPVEAEAAALLAPWEGPYGGLPPFDRASPGAIANAWRAALDAKRDEIHAIATNPEPPTFDNTLAALEDAGRALRRVDCLLKVYSATMSTREMADIDGRLAPLAAALDDEIAHDDALFARIDWVYQNRKADRLNGEQQRLAFVVRDRLERRGAGLDTGAKARLAEINGRLAESMSRFSQNLTGEQDAQFELFDDASDLDGLSDAARSAAASAAVAKGHPGKWAIANARPAVWPVLTRATRRNVRERIWRMWTMRGENPGPFDNRPVIAEILKLRGEKARLLGYPTFAHLATAGRMAGTPDTALALMQRVWSRVMGPTKAQLADLQGLAAADGIDRLAPWDRLYYAEKLRQGRFGLDGDAVKPYLELESVLRAMFWAAGRVHGVTFTELSDAPVCDRGIRVYEVSRNDRAVAVVWFDLFQRPGKTRGSWSSEYRAAESFRGRVLPIASVNSNLERPADGQPVLLTWEVANVFFHELGHALHMISSRASYPSLDSLAVPWDFIELPSLMNERWLYDRELLSRFARHCGTGEPMPAEMIDRIEQAAKFDRVFSVTLEYLGAAIVDMRAHLLADGRDIDALQLERDVLAELGLPEAVDLTLRIPHAYHTFTEMYAAGLYSYLWADVMAADVADRFARAPGGLYDAEVSARWRDAIVSAGSTVPAEQAFRDFMGRDPDPDALLRRFDL